MPYEILACTPRRGGVGRVGALPQDDISVVFEKAKILRYFLYSLILVVVG